MLRSVLIFDGVGMIERMRGDADACGANASTAPGRVATTAQDAVTAAAERIHVREGMVVALLELRNCRMRISLRTNDRPKNDV